MLQLRAPKVDIPNRIELFTLQAGTRTQLNRRLDGVNKQARICLLYTLGGHCNLTSTRQGEGRPSQGWHRISLNSPMPQSGQGEPPALRVSTPSTIVPKTADQSMATINYTINQPLNHGAMVRRVKTATRLQ